MAAVTVHSDFEAQENKVCHCFHCFYHLVAVKVKEESEKAGLKLNIQKPKIMASGPITSWQ